MKHLNKALLFIAFGLYLQACINTPAYEEIAIEYQEAKYVGDLKKARELSTPESAIILDFLEVIYEQNPYLKDMNKNASCSVTKSELSENGNFAQVTIEENNVYTGNLLSLNPPTLVETQETVIDLEKKGNKWLVVVK